MRPAARRPNRRCLGWRRRLSGPEQLAERFAEQERCGRRRPGWLQWDSAHRVRPAVDGRGDAVEVWLVEIALDELPRFTWRPSR